MIHLTEHSDLQVFSCDAMNSTFTLRLDCADVGRAQEASGACFNQLEELEAQLSRFRHDSDITRINQLQAGERLYISECTHACLLLAAEAQAATAGLFDVTLGGDVGQIEVAPDRPLVSCLAAGRQVDLGGIGKGFALDQLAVTLTSYQVESALLCAGASTLLAVGPQAWPVALTGDGVTEQISLHACALSASGTGIQGAHVVHPDCPGAEPPYLFKRVWLIALSASVADAYSTACLLMTDDEIEAFATVHRESVTMYAEDIKPPRIRCIRPD